MSTAAPRIALFTHDAYGLGHVRRSSRILGAVARKEPDASLLLITGSPATHLLRELPCNADTIKIPTIVTSGVEGTRPSTLNLPLAELASMRGELTRRALELFDPDVVLVDNFPLGTRLELIPALRELRNRPTRVVLGLRDVVDPPEKVRRDWGRDGISALIERFYDRVLVYGVPEVLDAAEAYDLSDAIASRLFYCGYVTDSAITTATPEDLMRDLGVSRDFFLATVGGGGDGRPLLEAFLHALSDFPDTPAVVVTGEFMSAGDRAAVMEKAAANRGVTVRNHVANLPGVIAAARLVVAMGGYNTSAEIISARSRAVLVPRTWRSGEHGARGKTGSDAEQHFRAQGLARLGFVTVLDNDVLSGRALSDAMRRALDADPGNRAAMPALDGAAVVADHLLELARRSDA